MAPIGPHRARIGSHWARSGSGHWARSGPRCWSRIGLSWLERLMTRASCPPFKQACVFACLPAQLPACPPAHMPSCPHALLPACPPACAHACSHFFLCLLRSASCKYPHMHVCSHTCACVCMRVCGTELAAALRDRDAERSLCMLVQQQAETLSTSLSLPLSLHKDKKKRRRLLADFYDDMPLAEAATRPSLFPPIASSS